VYTMHFTHVAASHLTFNAVQGHNVRGCGCVHAVLSPHKHTHVHAELNREDYVPVRYGISSGVHQQHCCSGHSKGLGVHTPLAAMREDHYTPVCTTPLKLDVGSAALTSGQACVDCDTFSGAAISRVCVTAVKALCALPPTASPVGTSQHTHTHTHTHGKHRHVTQGRRACTDFGRVQC